MNVGVFLEGISEYARYCSGQLCVSMCSKWNNNWCFNFVMSPEVMILLDKTINIDKFRSQSDIIY